MENWVPLKFTFSNFLIIFTIKVAIPEAITESGWNGSACRALAHGCKHWSNMGAFPALELHSDQLKWNIVKLSQHLWQKRMEQAIYRSLGLGTKVSICAHKNWIHKVQGVEKFVPFPLAPGLPWAAQRPARRRCSAQAYTEPCGHATIHASLWGSILPMAAHLKLAGTSWNKIVSIQRKPCSSSRKSRNWYSLTMSNLQIDK